MNILIIYWGRCKKEIVIYMGCSDKQRLKHFPSTRTANKNTIFKGLETWTAKTLIQLVLQGPVEILAT